MRYFLILIFLINFGCSKGSEPPVTQKVVPATVRSVRDGVDLVEKQHHVWRVTHPVLIAAATLADKKVLTYGFTIHDTKTYRDWLGDTWGGMVASRMDADPHPRVQFLHNKLPVAQSGLMHHDRVLSIEGQDLYELGAREATRIIQNFAAAKHPLLHLLIERKGEVQHVQIPGVETVPHAVSVIPAKELDCQRGENSIWITTGLLDYLENDHQLAMLYAHQLAHEHLGHSRKRIHRPSSASLVPDRVGQLPTYREQRMLAAARLGYSSNAEIQTDQIANRILSHATYHPSLAKRVWELLVVAPKEGYDVPILDRHPWTPNRALSEQQETKGMLPY